MPFALKMSLTIFLSLFLGTFLWLWARYGTDVVIANAEALANWCL